MPCITEDHSPYDTFICYPEQPVTNCLSWGTAYVKLFAVCRQHVQLANSSKHLTKNGMGKSSTYKLTCQYLAQTKLMNHQHQSE